MSSSPPERSSKRRTNVSKACINCRQRKKKCDGVAPVCGTCQTYKDECVWNSKTDWRKSVSRTEANELRKRVTQLEAELRSARAESVVSSIGSPVSAPSIPTASIFQPRLAETELGDSVRPPMGVLPSSLADHGLSLADHSLGAPPVASSSRPTFIITDSFDSSRVNTEVERQTEGDVDLDRIIVQDNRGRLRVHHPSSAYRHDTAGEPTAVTSPMAAMKSRTHIPDRDQFRRFLPDLYLTRSQHDLALDRFFRYFACWAQRATPHLFYRDMEVALWSDESDLPVMAPNYSPLLHNIILAIGLAFSDEEHLRALTTRRAFAAQGEKYLDYECSNPCVATVQALAIRSSFASTMGDYSLGWVNHGLANRLCYALGLHVNTYSLVARGKLNPEVAAQRNATFWTCFCQEAMWAIYIGRKPQMTDYTVPLPTADAATDQTQWKWPTGPFESLPSQSSYLSLAFIHTAKLFQISTEITRAIYASHADKASLVESGTIQRYSDILDGWLESLPTPLLVNSSARDPVLPHVLMVHLGWAWIIILLYQPFSQVASRGAGPHKNIGTIAMTRCHSAATKIVQLSALWRDHHSLRFTPPTMTAIIYSAGTSFLLAAAQASSPAQAEASVEKLHMCLDFLEQIGRTWLSGRQQAAILQDMLSECSRATFEIPAFMGGSDGGIHGWSARAGDKDGPTEMAEPVDTQAGPSVPAIVFQPPWSADTGFDQFIASLLSQSTVPIAAQTDLLGLEGFF